VNAVRGLLDFIDRLVKDHRPDQLVACMDADWRPQWRVELIPTYKAHRVAEEHAVGPDEEEVPDLLSPQVPIIEAVLDALGICRLGVAGYEADDVIGTLATAATCPTEIVTGDRDLFQLVDDARNVTVLYIVKGVGNAEVIDEAEITRRYDIPGRSYADFATMRGDPSDGLPGVPGVGDKTAAALLREFGTLDGILAAAQASDAGFPRGSHAKITAAGAYIEPARKVVAVAHDVPVGDLDPTLPSKPRDPDALDALSERWGLTSSVERVMEALATS
jgi:5'-3' exonuclease